MMMKNILVDVLENYKYQLVILNDSCIIYLLQTYLKNHKMFYAFYHQHNFFFLIKIIPFFKPKYFKFFL